MKTNTLNRYLFGRKLDLHNELIYYAKFTLSFAFSVPLALSSDVLKLSSNSKLNSIYVLSSLEGQIVTITDELTYTAYISFQRLYLLVKTNKVSPIRMKKEKVCTNETNLKLVISLKTFLFVQRRIRRNRNEN